MSAAGGSSGVSLLTVLGIVFIVLKLTDNIDWPWIWVLAPFWIAGILAVIVIVIALFFINGVRRDVNRRF